MSICKSTECRKNITPIKFGYELFHCQIFIYCRWRVSGIAIHLVWSVSKDWIAYYLNILWEQETKRPWQYNQNDFNILWDQETKRPWQYNQNDFNILWEQETKRPWQYNQKRL